MSEDRQASLVDETRENLEELPDLFAISLSFFEAWSSMVVFSTASECQEQINLEHEEEGSFPFSHKTHAAKSYKFYKGLAKSVGGT